MAREATARLYDVDDNSVVYKRLMLNPEKYDHGTITFRARRGKLIDLDKLHESIWATRLSGGTRSGLVSLSVTAMGDVVADGDEMLLDVEGSDEDFILVASNGADDAVKSAFSRLREAAAGGGPVRVTGTLVGWTGRWPEMLRKLPPKPRRIAVTGFELAKE